MYILLQHTLLVKIKSGRKICKTSGIFFREPIVSQENSNTPMSPVFPRGPRPSDARHGRPASGAARSGSRLPWSSETGLYTCAGPDFPSPTWLVRPIWPHRAHAPGRPRPLLNSASPPAESEATRLLPPPHFKS
jgi:hypothetical protein